MDVPFAVVALALVLAFVGGVVQGSVGFGLGLMISPILALARPELVPVSTMLTAALFPIATLIDEHKHVDWAAAGWIMLGRLPATVIGVWIVATVPVWVLQLVIAGIVLAMVGLSVVHVAIPRNRLTLGGAGFLGGVTGTATSIGGPPMAMVLSNDPPTRARATMAGVFLVGTGLSLTGLAIGGAIRTNALVIGLMMAPMSLIGMLVARRLRTRLTQRGFRRAVLALSSVAALVLVVRALS